MIELALAFIFFCFAAGAVVAIIGVACALFQALFSSLSLIPIPVKKEEEDE